MDLALTSNNAQIYDIVGLLADKKLAYFLISFMKAISMHNES